VVSLTQILNNLVQKQSSRLRQLPTTTRAELAETLGLLYYYKHSNVLKIYQNSKLDFETAKSAFTTGVFTLSDENDSECQVLKAFYSLLFKSPDQITAKESDIDVDKILHLKQSSTFTQFSVESHLQKAKLLLRPLAANTLKALVKKESSDARTLTQIGLLVKMISISQEAFVV